MLKFFYKNIDKNVRRLGLLCWLVGRICSDQDSSLWGRMIQKLIIIIAFAISVAVIADYYGVIDLPSLEKPTALENRDQMIHKTEKTIKDL